MRILFVASEGLPFSKTGGLADVVEALPKALVELGHEVAVVLPRYRNTKATAIVMPSLTVPMGATLRFPAIADGTVASGVRYFFVDDPEYFDRDQLYGERGKDYIDNAERFGEFSRAAVEVAKHVWPADVIHCHDWQSALVPVLLRTLYETDPLLRGVPVVFTIHNMGYHGLFPRDTLAALGLPETLFRMDAVEFFGKVNFLKAGLVFADYLTTVSRKYAQEIQTAEYGHGLGRRGTQSRFASAGDPEWRGLFDLESGKRHADRGALFGEGFERQESLQERPARTIQPGYFRSEASGDRHRFALRGAKRF